MYSATIFCRMLLRELSRLSRLYPERIHVDFIYSTSIQIRSSVECYWESCPDSQSSIQNAYMGFFHSICIQIRYSVERYESVVQIFKALYKTHTCGVLYIQYVFRYDILRNAKLWELFR